MIQRIIEIFQKIIISNKEKEEKENTRKKLELFSERKILNVTPNSDLSNIWAAVINELETNEEIWFLAELVKYDIRIHIEMKNGKVYKDILHSSDYAWFIKNFEILNE